MPNYNVPTRKFGDGWTFIAAHAAAGEEAGVPFDGEIALATLITQANAAGDSLKGYTEASELAYEAEMFADMITQEAAAVQNVPVSITANAFKVTMSIGDAQNLVYALGLTDINNEADVLGAGDDADTIVMGLRKPAEVSLLHQVKNSQVAALWFDYLYMPRATVDPNLLITFLKSGVRNSEVLFNLQPSHQDGTLPIALQSQDMLIASSGTHGTVKIFYQTAT